MPKSPRPESSSSSYQYDYTLPQVTAHSFAIFDCVSRKFLSVRKETMKREVASLTKMMTFYTAIKLLHRFNLTPQNVLITISEFAANLRGTSAHLKAGDILNVDQLFYAMMLPSGNDAAYTIAEYFGTLLEQKKKYHLTPIS